MVKINRKEYHVLQSLDDKWKWITRDRYRDEREYENVLGGIRVFQEKPFKRPNDNHFGLDGTGMGIDWLYLDRDMFFFIKSYDDKPYNIAELVEDFEEAVRINEIFEKSTKIGLKKSEESKVKSKQELIEKWESAIESAEFYGRGREGELISYMKDFVGDLNQLDEPEVLTQEWIDEHKMYCLHSMQNGYFISEELLQNILVPKQEEMKVPKMWHDVIVKNKEDGHSLRWTLNYIDDLNVNDVDSFARAWIAYPNIEVEEEQKFYVMSNDNRMMLVRMMDDKTITEADSFPFDGLYDTEKKSYRLTEQEIKDYDPRYCPFRKPVEDMEERE